MRNSIFDYLKKELIGPDPIKPYIQSDGEEILINEPPRLRYSAGILFPQTITYSRSDSTSDEEMDAVEISDLDDEDPIQTADTNTHTDVAEDFEEEIGLANNFLPSAMGLSCFSIIPKNGFEIDIKAGCYQTDKFEEVLKDGRVINKQAFYRRSLDQKVKIPSKEIPTEYGSFNVFDLKDSNNEKINLKLHIRNRTHFISRNQKEQDFHLLTFTLINTNEGNSEIVKNEDCFFQVSFSIESAEDCFGPYKEISLKTYTEDEQSNHLLYRNKKTFAVGHGCSPTWTNEKADLIDCIVADVIPSYEIKPIIPNSLPEVELKMFDFSDLSNEDFISNLKSLCDHYEKWISDQEAISKELNHEFLETAKRHISSCKNCLARMRRGVKLIQSNEFVNRAFRLMNRAMLLQQLHYSIDTRTWKIEKNKLDELEMVQMPDIQNPATWKKGLGAWRPFQIAFVIMNLNAMLDPDDSDRKMVDLIWFPTGGGKTEAYLGLSAFSIFLKRLRNPEDSGTTVLMRYTLRLLTAQQFQRAASLICACDLIRSEFVNELGSDRITIGLWVGESLTPLSRQNARNQLRKIETGQERSNPFILLKCPWCGAQMGLIETSGRNKVIKGYKRRGTPQTVIYKCDNSDCDFHSDAHPIPCQVIDEDIYENPPTLLIGTVDKFAMLTWKPEARTLFGFRDNGRITPPELIIQDELHLISGPLGSMVGLYETMIEELCTKDRQLPKIIASSATISRAKEQINSLYGRGVENVTIFPPQCINAGDSFFALEDDKGEGRKYIGIFASGLPSHATAQVRVLSSLLQAIKSVPVEEEIERDPYWTILAYFNSIRELGHAATLIRADIREYMNSIWIRKGIQGDERRFINKDIELTSRINSSEIPEYLEQLSRSWTGDKTRYPVDVCLATNMISVGVDISRLGLMTVVGQPKTTSEYIQATSRVGRSKKGPGMVLTIYNCSKPRDRSHFEHFQEYHSKIYSKVEPTSVTPFSAPSRERAIHAILIGLIRFYSEANRDAPRPFPNDAIIEKVTQLIYDRVDLIDPSEYEKTIDLIEEKLEYWKNEQPVIYGSFGQPNNIPLMYPAGSIPTDDIRARSWATPTSMRNVDATCDAFVITEYPNNSVSPNSDN